MTIYGPIVGAEVVEEAVLTRLKLWLPQYLAEVAGQVGVERGRLRKPRSWQVLPAFDNALEEALPAIMVISPGLNDRPVKEGDGTYRGTWAVGVGVLVTAKDQAATRILARRYGAAIRACVGQRGSLVLPDVRGVSWEGENFDDVPPFETRTLASATVSFSVEQGNLFNPRSGPVTDTPEDDPTSPYPEWGTIPDKEHVSVTVEKRQS